MKDITEDILMITISDDGRLSKNFIFSLKNPSKKTIYHLNKNDLFLGVSCYRDKKSYGGKKSRKLSMDANLKNSEASHKNWHIMKEVQIVDLNRFSIVVDASKLKTAVKRYILRHKTDKYFIRFSFVLFNGSGTRKRTYKSYKNIIGEFRVYSY